MGIPLLPLVLLAISTTGVSSLEPPYSQWMTDSMIRRGFEPSFHYDQATLYTSIEQVYESNKNQTVKNFYRSKIDAIVLKDGTINGFDHTHYSLDNYRFGNNLLWWFGQTGESKFKVAADAIKKQLDRHPRTPTGGFWHRSPVYANQMWLDGIYMADSFYAKWVSLFQPNNQSAWNDIVLQFDNIDAHTRKSNGLLVHGYDESKKAVWADPTTGASPLVWGRAVGWYFMSLLEVIQLFPASHPGRQRLLGYYVKLAKGLKDAQDEKGAWWNVMDKQYEDVKGNYLESSASVMFTFGLLKGLNLGLLTESEYGAVSKKAYQAMLDLFVTKNKDGTINWEGTVEVGSLNSNASFQYYSSIPVRKNDLRGGGVFMIAALESEKRS